MMKTKKDITLHNVMFPIWFLIMFPITWIIVLPANFVIDSIVFLICTRLLRLTGIGQLYKRSILKIWLVGFASDFVGAGILFLTLDSSASWYEYLQSVSWNPFDNWYALLFVAFAVSVAGICIYFGNLKYSLRNIETSQRNKRIIALALAMLTAPYILFYPSSLLNGGSWDDLRFMTNHIVKMDEYRLEVAINGLISDDAGAEDTIVMSYYERMIKDAVNEAEKTDELTEQGSGAPDFTLFFYNRYFTGAREIPVWVKDAQGYFPYENQWYIMDKEQIEPFLKALQDVRDTRGKKEFAILPDPGTGDPGEEMKEKERESTDKEGRKLSEYPVFQDSRNLYYCSEREKFDGALIRFEDGEEMDIYTALETGLVSPQDLINHGLELVAEKREWKENE